VPLSVWTEIRDWLGVDPQLDLQQDDPSIWLFQNNKNQIPWERSTFSQNRPVAQFGAHYDYVQDKVVVDRSSTGGTSPLPIPEILQQLLQNDGELSDVSSYTQCIINVYDSTTFSHIPWHVDDPAFGPTVVVYTFGQERPLYLRRKSQNGHNYIHYTAYPRHLSRYILSNEARDLWEHSVPTGGTDWRISITFRSLRQPST
jgi:hypothetical protein